MGGQLRPPSFSTENACRQNVDGMIHGLTPMPSLGPSLGAVVDFDFSSDPVDEQSSLVALLAQVAAGSALLVAVCLD